MKGTTRGLHFQFPPASEAKVVSCTRGRLFDVIVDLRPESPTYLHHFSVELSAENRRSIFVPERFAHGHQTLEDSTETTYLMGDFYAPDAAGGLACEDPRLAIRWPLPMADMSTRDREWRPLSVVEPELRAKMTVES
jgi:dTDP-4-dehydrorhamnose 3,5-epimerase